ncbi:LRR receptor-like serine/threonine-protein kinase GSO1-like [Hibiscus syriacus]|uniref:LRR receptor-like serine/threonine-protein kinase GSO1-like n=1 Tax=Hibiscus syriacus TaxID=106335 RepID=A0A6A3BHW5_HIBSY|nr:LRR receptor-like serine/threonine-protein kinase GSO1-like [Hibiscus syriacus]
MLHPDKNKSIGAEGAFKLISESWSLLSDKARRVAYDKRRGGKVAQAVPALGGSSKASKTVNGFYNAAKTSTSSMKTSKSSNPHGAQSSTPSGQSSNPASSHKPKPNTFWTICHQCKMHYEYLRVYLNHNLLCPNCHEPFLAVETAPPTTSTTTPWTFSQQRQNSNSQASNKSSNNMGRNHSSSYNAAGFTSHDSYNQSNFQCGPFSRTSGASTAAQAASVVQQAYEKARREREEAQAATKREEAMRKKYHGSKRAGVSSSGYTNAAKRRRGMEDGSACAHGTNITNQMGVGNGGPANLSGPKLGSIEAGWINGTNKYNNARDISQVEIQSMLIHKAKREIRKKLNEWNSSPAAKTTSKDIRGNENSNDKQNKSLLNNDAWNRKKAEGSVDEINGDHFAKPFPGSFGVGLDAETLEAMSINVPDPDFHDFDRDRTKRSFEDNQVWAAYDDDDGMPRYYAMIHSKLGSAGLIQKLTVNSVHLTGWTKGMRGAIFIYPRKGEVWAIHRHWSRDWNELTTNDVIHKYDMVEMLDDYKEELGVRVTPLVKVTGFKTVFHRHLDHREIWRIPREEMFRFSHQVPSYLITGQEAPNAPKGCRELDPAATPVELLQIIMDVKDEEILENGKMIGEDNVVDVKKATYEGMVFKVNWFGTDTLYGLSDALDWSSNAYYVELLPYDDLQVDEIQRVDVHSFWGFLRFIVKAQFGASSGKWKFFGFQKQQVTHAIR